MSIRPLSLVRRNICVLLLALLVLSWGYFFFSFTRDHRTIEQECHTYLLTLAVGMEEHARHLVQVIDILLQEITQHFSHYSADELLVTVAEWFRRSPELATLAVLDVASGEILFSLNGAQLDVAVSADALTALAGEPTQLQIADKLYFGSDGRQQIAFTRQFNYQGRDLLTVFFLYADSFLDFHPNLDLGSNSAVEVFNQQGMLLARDPAGSNLRAHSFADLPLFRVYLPKSPVGIIEESQSIDAIRRIVAYRKLDDLPLIITVGTTVASVFHDWQSRLINFLLIQVVVSLTVLTALVMSFRTLRRAEKVEIDLEEREEHFRAMANSSVDAVISVDTSERVLFWSVGAEQTFGCSAEEALNMPITCFLQFADEEIPLTLKQLADVNSPWSKPKTLDVQGQRKSGEVFPTELSISRGTAGGQRLYTLIVRDVTERKSMEERVRRMASHDHLTGLPNRTLLMDRLQVAMAQVRRQGGQFALLFIDLDKFKPVNDNYGHDVGDRLLQQVATRMLDAIRASDTVARIGGDEFALLLNNIENCSAVHSACENLLTSLRRSFNVSGIQIEISCSIGVALFNGQDSDAGDLLKRADNAMYKAKRDGKNGFVFAADSGSNES
ncbi:diguanylate cyclase [Malonomonas rubra]|uniref:diguanylate cyclase domain-containing protein n=1 Tax=Malonomonas rubra TaxID=57040 RepID=UPI0026F1CF7D|nr:diguanylate cyclase [Malonomonas rubra]